MNRYSPLAPVLAILVAGVAGVVVVIFAYAAADPRPAPAPIMIEATAVEPIPSPTAAPTPTPAPTIQPPSGMGPERVIVAAPAPIDIAYKDWYIVTLAFEPADHYRALRTSWCESLFIDTERGADGEVGRFQIMVFWLNEPGIQAIIESWFPGATGSLDAMIAAMEDPHVNAQVAAWILENNGNGWGPWTTRFGCEGWQG